MIIALTGTPGTGKTSAGKELRKRGYAVTDLSELISSEGLKEEYDSERDTYEVDTDRLSEYIADSDGITFIEGHLAHLLPCDMIIVMRCRPDVLAERLRGRCYGGCKIRENVQAEILDVILCESVSSGIPVYEVDSTSLTAEESADLIEKIAEGGTEGFEPGNTDWTKEAEKWFWTDRETKPNSH